MKQLAFNTKRLYTKFGQRIVATLYPDNIVTFCDIDRGIAGEFKIDPEYDIFDQKTVMHFYDHNLYQGTVRSMQDSMYADSVNSLTRYENGVK